MLWDRCYIANESKVTDNTNVMVNALVNVLVKTLVDVLVNTLVDVLVKP